MRYMPSTWIPCADCDGQRFTEKVLAAQVPFGNQLVSIADFYDRSIAEVKEFFASETRLPAARRSAAQRILEALCDIGLGICRSANPRPRFRAAKRSGSSWRATWGKNHWPKNCSC